jgi:hypothetical protein
MGLDLQICHGNWVRMKIKYTIKVYAFYVVCIVFMAGCYTTGRGLYEAGDVPGWRRDTLAGATFFHYPTKNVPDWEIRFRGEIGTLNVALVSKAYDPSRIWPLLSFSRDPIVVQFNGQQSSFSVPADGFQTPYGQSINTAGSRDITVILPSFTIGTNEVPKLVVHLRWSDREWHDFTPEIM